MIDPTGVGKHQINMVMELAKREDVDLELLVPVRDATPDAMAALRLGEDVRLRMIPWKARTVERLWNSLGWPSYGRECSEADWLYSPFEAMPPSRKTPHVATIHQAMWFDKDIQWYDSWGRFRMGQRRLYDRIAEKCDKIICVSEYLKDRFVALFPSSAGRIAVVYNGVEDVYFDAGAERWV